MPAEDLAIGATDVLDRATWGERERAHEDRVDTATASYRARRDRGVKHPTEDFLFTYYPVTPGRLRRWHPGVGVGLDEAAALPRAAWRFYRTEGAVVRVDAGEFAARRSDELAFIRELLTALDDREPALGCFALHEWAMVYRLPPDELRHTQLPLRLGSAGTDAVVESHSLRCTHIDAYRFFTVSAAARNTFRPRRDTQLAWDQPGCLHAGMDLYKWAVKLSPAAPSDLVMDCFELARELRDLDMRASPYDVSVLGAAPIPVETADGKSAYLAALGPLLERASALRARLVTVCDLLGPAEPAVRAGRS